MRKFSKAQDDGFEECGGGNRGVKLEFQFQKSAIDNFAIDDWAIKGLASAVYILILCTR